MEFPGSARPGLIDEATVLLGKKPPSAPRELKALLKAYYIPGNVRELRSMVVDAVTHHPGGILSMARFKEHGRHLALVADVATSPGTG